MSSQVTSSITAGDSEVDNSTPVGRTLTEFDAEEDLRMALMNMDIRSREDTEGTRDDSPADPPSAARETGERNSTEIEDDWDWALTNYDVENTVPQSVAAEAERLKNLQTYQLVGEEREEAFDRLTTLAGRVFDVPISVVTVIDIGRQWFVSSRGLGEGRQTTRKVAFCSHTIMNQERILEVPDTTEDYRFKDSQFVTGAPYIRFYAGCSLITPEGYKLGTLCLIDNKPWPNGLTDNQRATLIDLAGMAMKTMVDRRELRLKVRKNCSAIIANTANDLMTPLAGVRFSLKTLQNDANLNKVLDRQMRGCLETACDGTDMIHKICSTTIEEIEEDQAQEKGMPQGPKQHEKSVSGKATSADVHTEKKSSEGDSNSSEHSQKTIQQLEEVVDMKDCVKRLHRIINPIPKKVPLVISIEPQVPLRIISNDLKILRACLNILSNACSRTIRGKIHFRIFRRDDQLVFECQDNRSTPDVSDVQDHDMAQEPDCLSGQCGESNSKLLNHADMSDLALHSLQAQVESLNGRYGYRCPRGLRTRQDIRGQPHSNGSYFWFSIPIQEPPIDPPYPQPFKYAKEFIDSPMHPLKGPVDCSDVRQFSSSSNSPPSLQLLPSRKPLSSSVVQTPKRNKSALVVEDSVVVRNTLARVLTKQGYEVVTAADGTEGLRELQDRVFDVTFCDFMMPIMDGIDCISRYRQWEREHRPQFSQYIIGVSAHASPNDIAKGLQVGMNEYKSKPITTKVMAELCSSADALRCSSFLDRVPVRFNQYCFGEKQDYTLEKNRISSQAVRRATRNREEMEFESSSSAGFEGTGVKRLKTDETAYSCMPNVAQKAILLTPDNKLSGRKALAS